MLDGRLSATVVLTPFLSIIEMREPVLLPWYGPTGGTTCAHVVLKFVPPTPASATYRLPSGPNLRPRGSFNPVTRIFCVVTVTLLPPHSGGDSYFLHPWMIKILAASSTSKYVIFLFIIILLFFG